MKNARTLIYDGSFNGFLTAVFKCFEEKLAVADIQRSGQAQNGLFSETETIFTHVEKAKRVWNGIRKKSPSAMNSIYFAYLSGTENIELRLLDYIKKIMGPNASDGHNYTDDTELCISQLAKKVAREKLRMEALVRFQLTKDDIYFANIAPDFDVLPLISKHFKDRYADQNWLIYDVKRKYGIYYDQQRVTMVSLQLDSVHHNRILKSNAMVEDEYHYQELWASYFKQTNIKERINPRLHEQHLPKRYWKYLPEKKVS